MAELPAWMTGPDPAADTVHARVTDKVTLADAVIGIDLAPLETDQQLNWDPGAHIDIHLPEGAVRQYSLCGEGAAPGSLRVAVLREPDGRGGSRYLHDELEVGDVIVISRPRNNFALEPADRYLFVAGGIGITPIVPMISAADQAGIQWSLLYGGRRRASMAFLGELEHRPQVTVVSQEEQGLLDLDAFLDATRPGTLIYCCGPESLLLAVEERGRCWPKGVLHLERFSPRLDSDRSPGESFTIMLRRSGVELTVAPGQSILDVVAAAGISVPSSCEEGTCGTCETIVLEGEPDHRDSVLSPADREANDCMMICVSRACGSRLVLEL